MKRLLSLSLAMILALGMASAVFATTTTEYEIETTGYTLDDDGVIDVAGDSDKIDEGDTVNPGDTVYYLIHDADGEEIDDSDMVKGVTIKQTWDMGKEYVQSVSVVKKKYVTSTTSAYYYFLAVAYKNSTSTSAYDVTGEITIKKTTTTNTVGIPFTATLDINNGFAFDEADDFNITDETMLFNFSSTGELGDGSAVTGDQTFSILDEHYFDVDVTGQGKLLLYADTDYNSTIAAKYPAANLEFLNMNGASFNKTGELTILADPDTYLYSVNSDGSLSKVKAEYDEYEEAFKVTTRTLGKYVVSDIELNVSSASSSSSEEEVVAVIIDDTNTTSSTTTTVVKANPSTGAAA